MQSKKYIIKIIYLISFLLLLIVYTIGQTFMFSSEPKSMDSLHVYNSNYIAKALTRIGTILWIITASICFFSGSLLRKKRNHKNAYFLIVSGIMTLILLGEDFFMLRDYIFIEYLNIEQITTYCIYSGIVMLYIYKYYKFIETEFYESFLLAFGFFGSYIVMEYIFPNTNMVYLLKDVFKLLGIISWTLFFASTSANKILQKQLIRT